MLMLMMILMLILMIIFDVYDDMKFEKSYARNSEDICVSKDDLNDTCSCVSQIFDNSDEAEILILILMILLDLSDIKVNFW